jgi:hypothetical protein
MMTNVTIPKRRSSQGIAVRFLESGAEKRGGMNLEQDSEKDQMPRIFFRPFVEVEDGLVEWAVPQEIIDDALDRIQKVISRALRHAGEAENGEIDADDSDASEEGQ